VSNGVAVSVVDAFESLREFPIRRGGVHGSCHRAIASDDLEGKRLAYECAVTGELPLLAPVALHGVPIRVVALDGELLHVARASHVCHENKNEVRISVDGEAHAASLLAPHPVFTRKAAKRTPQISHQRQVDSG
jgi:hypothetical protein